MKRQFSRGLSLIELLVALTIGTVLIFGATQVYVRSRATYSVNEATSRLQETARYAMSVMEPDVRMANYWGLLKVPFAVTGSASQAAAAAPIANSAAAVICGNNYAVDVENSVQGDNNAYTISASRQAGCNTLGTPVGGIWTTTAVTSADTLTIRRASTAGAAGGVVATNGRLQICSQRDKAWLFSNGAPNPACPAAPSGQISDVFVDIYYVDRNSGQNDTAKVTGTPSLRRKFLTSVGGVMQFQDQEIIPGVEDLQVQYGIDPNYGVDPYGTGATPANATRYVNANQAQVAVAAGAQIVAVRLWLLVRSDSPEVNFVDTRTYEYADRLQATGTIGDINTGGAGRAFVPSLNAVNTFTGIKRYRRLLVSRTIQLRNAMGT